MVFYDWYIRMGRTSTYIFNFHSQCYSFYNFIYNYNFNKLLENKDFT